MRLLFLMAATLLAGCAVVTIEGASGSQHFIHFGTLSIRADQPDSAIVSTVHGMGVTVQDGTLNLGYVSQEKVQVLEPSRCYLIVIIQSNKEARKIKETLGSMMENACTNK